jgi:hypothetical protein
VSETTSVEDYAPKISRIVDILLFGKSIFRLTANKLKTAVGDDEEPQDIVTLFLKV